MATVQRPMTDGHAVAGEHMHQTELQPDTSAEVIEWRLHISM
jgi:hypothetical protein